MFSYFTEIKNRFVLSTLNIFTVTIVGYLYKEVLLFVLLKSSIYISFKKKKFIFSYLIFTNVTEIFNTYLTLISFFNIQIFFVYFFLHLFSFFSSAFFQSEYFYFKFCLKTIIIVWLVSALAINFVLIPFMWLFFFSFQDLSGSFNLHFEGKLNEFIFFYMYIYYFCEFYFQFLTFCFLLFNYKKINIKSVKKVRKVVYYFFIICSSFFIGLEAFSQFFLNLSIIVFYEFITFLLISKIVLGQFSFQTPTFK